MSFAATESVSESNDPSFETFDNFDTIAEEAEAAEDDWSKPEPEAKEKVSEDLKVIKDSQADSEGKVIKEDKKAKEESEDDSEDEEEESEEEEAEDEEEVKEDEELEAKEDKEEKPKSKLRMRMGDDIFNVTSDATFKVKVDGKVEDVPVQELINNYSGKTAWDKKFTEIGKEKKALESERNTFVKQRDEVIHHLQTALNPLKDPEGNPLDSLLYLVELSGDDPYNAYRRIMEANLEELSDLLEKSELERELHFRNKKDELHGKVAKKRQEKMQKEEAFNQTLQKVDSLRQSLNVSEDQFVEASDELEDLYSSSGLDVNDITTEAIVDYASLKPHIAVVKELVAPYEDNISEEKYGDVVAELSRYLRNGDADAETIKQILARNFSVEEDVKELNTKVYSRSAKAPAKKALKQESEQFESFDDWN